MESVFASSNLMTVDADQHRKPGFDNIVILRFTRTCFHLSCVIAVLAGTTLIPTYNTNTAQISTSSFFNDTSTTVTIDTDDTHGFQYFDRINSKITEVDHSLLWFPVGVCAMITVIVMIVLIYQTRKVGTALFQCS